MPGLRVRVLPNGTRSWSLNIRDAKGERRRFEVGSGLGMAEARKTAEDLRRAVRTEADPTAERRGVRLRGRAARENVGTLHGLLDHHFAKGPGARHRRATAVKQLISTVFTEILRTPLFDLDRSTIQLIADDWRSASTASSTVRSLRPCLK